MSSLPGSRTMDDAVTQELLAATLLPPEDAPPPPSLGGPSYGGPSYGGPSYGGPSYGGPKPLGAVPALPLQEEPRAAAEELRSAATTARGGWDPPRSEVASLRRELADMKAEVARLSRLVATGGAPPKAARAEASAADARSLLEAVDQVTAMADAWIRNRRRPLEAAVGHELPPRSARAEPRENPALSERRRLLSQVDSIITALEPR